MRRIRVGCLTAGFLVWIGFGFPSSQAQYTANFRTNIISGVVSNWSGSYNVGGVGDVLLVRNGGVLNDGEGIVGGDYTSSNNTVLVSDPGSVWSNYAGLYIGEEGVANTLIVSNGGKVISLAEAGIGWDFGGTNTVVVTGTGSVWSTPTGIVIGYYGSSNQLVIRGGGQVASGFVTMGSIDSNNAVVVADPGSEFNCSSFNMFSSGGSLVISNGGQMVSGSGTVSVRCHALITGVGSAWNIANEVVVGTYGAGASLVISNGGQVSDTTSSVGAGAGSSNNVVNISGDGSVWSNAVLYVGNDGAWNGMVMSNSAVVTCSNCVVGSSATGSSNSVSVTTGAQWQCGTLAVGWQGGSNSVVVKDGQVTATNLVIGAVSPTCDNLLQVAAGKSYVYVTNATSTGVLEVRNGVFVLGNGLVKADTFVMTNPCAQFVHTGGALIVGNVILDPNTFRIVSVTPTGNDMLITWMMAPGATNTLQATAGDGSGGYSTNSFSDIFIVTNNTTVGAVTNYLERAGPPTSRRGITARGWRRSCGTGNA